MIRISSSFLYAIILVLLVFFAVPSKATTQWSVNSATNLTSVGAITPSLVSQTSSAGNPNGKAPYWSFTGHAGATYFFGFLTSASTEDLVMSVYNGLYTSGTSTLVAANDDWSSSNIKSGMTFVCPATQTYYILVDNSNSALPFTFNGTGSIILTYYECGGVSTTSPPISESWAGANVISTACTSWMMAGAGSEGDWTISATTNAGGTSPELYFYSNQANIYGIGQQKIVTATSYPIATSGMTSMVFTWKHTLNLTFNSAANGTSGSDNVTLKLQTSNDQITWTDQYSATYVVQTSGPTTPVNKVTQSVTINTSANDTTWIRFYMQAVPFKVSGWYIDNGASGTIVLPIELETFAAKYFNSDVKLDWSTATETNNAQFVIERSANGKDFSFLTSVQGSGTSYIQKTYSTIDESPLPGVSYYRLKQTDFNGRYSYSQIVSVESTPEGWLGRPHPNPATNEVNFTLNASREGTVSIELLDVTGRLVLNEDRPVHQGNQSLSVSMSTLAKGIYYFRVREDEHGYSPAIKLTKE